MATRNIEVPDVAELPSSPKVGELVYLEGRGLLLYAGLPTDERPVDGWVTAGPPAPEQPAAVAAQQPASE